MAGQTGPAAAQWPVYATPTWPDYADSAVAGICRLCRRPGPALRWP